MKKIVKESLNEETQKIYTIECENSGGYMSRGPSRYYYQTGTLAELIQAYSYTLEVGQSWEREKGNRKVNRNPKSVDQLVNNLNIATNNAAANGYSGKYYRILPEGEPKKGRIQESVNEVYQRNKVKLQEFINKLNMLSNKLGIRIEHQRDTTFLFNEEGNTGFELRYNNDTERYQAVSNMMTIE